MTDIEKKICNALIALLEKTPIEKITVTEICRAAGVSKRSFYNYFCDKYDVIIKVQAIPELVNDAEDVSLETLENFFRDRYKWLLEHRGFLRNISFYLGQNSSIVAFHKSVQDLLWKIIRKNAPDVEETPELMYTVAHFSHGYLYFVIKILLTDPDFCEEYFEREHFIREHIPALLLKYL